MDQASPTLLGADTVAGFCKRNNIGKSTYYELKRAGLGPDEIAIGSKGKRITAEAEARWLKKMEERASAEIEAA